MKVNMMIRSTLPTLKYIKLTPQEHAEKMRDMWRRAGNHLKVSNDRY